MDLFCRLPLPASLVFSSVFLTFSHGGSLSVFLFEIALAFSGPCLYDCIRQPSSAWRPLDSVGHSSVFSFFKKALSPHSNGETFQKDPPSYRNSNPVRAFSPCFLSYPNPVAGKQKQALMTEKILRAHAFLAADTAFGACAYRQSEQIP